MSKDQYLEMMEQMGEDPTGTNVLQTGKIFQISNHSVNIFHSMGDRIYPEIGYIGKDYTNL